MSFQFSNCGTPRMSYLWICLSLFYAASFLKSSASSTTSVHKPGVSLECNETVGVEEGKDVILYCSISYSESLKNNNCTVEHYEWSNTAGITSCNTDQYTCKLENQTLSLNILGVNKNESYNVSVDTDCGPTTSSAINVRVKRVKHDTPDTGRVESPEATGIVTPVVLGIFATLFVFGILCFLFLTEKGRRIIRQTKSHIRSPV